MLKITEWKKIYYNDINKKRGRVGILLSDKVGFGANNITMDKEGHFLIIKGLIYQDKKY